MAASHLLAGWSPAPCMGRGEECVSHTHHKNTIRIYHITPLYIPVPRETIGAACFESQAQRALITLHVYSSCHIGIHSKHSGMQTQEDTSTHANANTCSTHKVDTKSTTRGRICLRDSVVFPWESRMQGKSPSPTGWRRHSKSPCASSTLARASARSEP